MLQRYIRDPRNVPQNDVKMFPPAMRLNLYSRSDFVKRVFWKRMRKPGAMIVGFNLPFDLSRLAVKATASADGGWSFILSQRKSRKSGEIEIDLERPRVSVTSKDGQTAFIRLRDIFRPEEWPFPREGRFLDLHTLGWALRNESCNLDDWCGAFGVEGKIKHKPTGRVTVKEIKYCLGDVRATTRLLNAMKVEFDQHPPELPIVPEGAYSPATIAKAYLDAMKIARPKSKFKVSDRALGIGMQAYYGGRAECRIRKTPVPVVLTDFTSQYPTVNALLGNWSALTAKSVRFIDCKNEVRHLLGRVKRDDTFYPTFWKRLSFFALVQPDDDIVPVRTVYNGRTQNIGLNYLRSKEPVWFAGPDLVASRLLTDSPENPKSDSNHCEWASIRIAAYESGRQGRDDPNLDDFFCHVIEQKAAHKRTNKALSNFLKVARWQLWPVRTGRSARRNQASECEGVLRRDIPRVQSLRNREDWALVLPAAGIVDHRRRAAVDRHA